MTCFTSSLGLCVLTCKKRQWFYSPKPSYLPSQNYTRTDAIISHFSPPVAISMLVRCRRSGCIHSFGVCSSAFWTAAIRNWFAGSCIHPQSIICTSSLPTTASGCGREVVDGTLVVCIWFKGQAFPHGESRRVCSLDAHAGRPCCQ
jgi:hypothetical protein